MISGLHIYHGRATHMVYICQGVRQSASCLCRLRQKCLFFRPNITQVVMKRKVTGKRRFCITLQGKNRHEECLYFSFLLYFEAAAYRLVPDEGMSSWKTPEKMLVLFFQTCISHYFALRDRSVTDFVWISCSAPIVGQSRDYAILQLC
jgi:hypothetical protein